MPVPFWDGTSDPRSRTKDPEPGSQDERPNASTHTQDLRSVAKICGQVVCS